MEEMAKRAQQQREAFLKQVQEQQAQRKSKNANGRTWNMEKKLKITDNEKYTL